MVVCRGRCVLFSLASDATSQVVLIHKATEALADMAETKGVRGSLLSSAVAKTSYRMQVCLPSLVLPPASSASGGRRRGKLEPWQPSHGRARVPVGAGARAGHSGTHLAGPRLTSEAVNSDVSPWARSPSSPTPRP